MKKSDIYLNTAVVSTEYV